MVSTPQVATAPVTTVGAYLAVLRLARKHGYIITRLKMAKLLYLSDLTAVREGHDPISGLEWRWLNYGPFDNTLQHLENELESSQAVERNEYFGGYQIRLVTDPTGYDMAPADMEFLERIVSEYGGLAATTLKDLSYQTPPMVDAMKRERGVVLDLSLARPRPKLGELRRRMSAVLRELPEQTLDPGVAREIQQEMNELAEARGRATGAILGE